MLVSEPVLNNDTVVPTGVAAVLLRPSIMPGIRRLESTTKKLQLIYT